MNRSTHAYLVAFLVAAFAPGATLEAGPADVSDRAAPVNAVWVDYERSLVYFGQTTYYSCYGLRDKVRYILQQVGARSDLKVTASCVESSGFGVEAMPSVRIKAAFATEATPEVLQRMEEDAPRRELIARVQGQGDGVDSVTAQFPAVWQRVELEDKHRGRIEAGDCELLEQLVEQVFVPVGMRVAPESRLGCMRHQVPVGSVRLLVDTLQKAPEPDAVPAGSTAPASVLE